MFRPRLNPVEPPWYGPVCPVVWEGRCRETPPYPDRLGLVALDGTKVRANAALDANRTASSLEAQVAKMLAEAAAADTQEDRQFGAQRGDELPAALARRAERLARLQRCQEKLQRQAADAAGRSPVQHARARTLPR